MTHYDNSIRKIEHGVENIFKNDWFTTRVTLKFSLSKDSNKFKVYERHKHIFLVIKSDDNTSNIITNSDKTFGNPNKFTEEQDYITHFLMSNTIKQ